MSYNKSQHNSYNLQIANVSAIFFSLHFLQKRNRVMWLAFLTQNLRSLGWNLKTPAMISCFQRAPELDCFLVIREVMFSWSVGRMALRSK